MEEIESKYVASDPALIDSLSELTELEGYRLIPLGEKLIADRYLDTSEHDLRRNGFALRFRESSGGLVASLKGLGGSDSGIHVREEIEQSVSPNLNPDDWPDGPVRDRVLSFHIDRPLRELFVIHQKRILRRIVSEDRMIGEFSLDTVRIQSNGHEKTFKELEIELKGDGSVEDLKALDRALTEIGLRPENRSKYDVGFSMLDSSAESGSLSHDEKAELIRISELPDTAWSKRARMILRYVEGASSLEIGKAVGVSDSYARRWIRKWRESRMECFSLAPGSAVDRSDATDDFPSPSEAIRPSSEVGLEAISQPSSETASEAISQPSTETASEAISQPSTETASEAISQPSTEAASEAISQPSTETASETISQPSTETASEAISQPSTETSSEATRSERIADAPPIALEPAKLTVEQLCARYAVDKNHARHVAAMSLALFDAFPEIHGLSVERRKLLETAAWLHNVGMNVNPKKHHTVGREIVLSEPIRGISEEERSMLACCVRFHRKLVQPEKEPVFLALSPSSQRETLALSALLRVGDAFDYSGSQTSRFISLKSLNGIAQAVVGGRYAGLEASRAETKADLWNLIFPALFQALTQERATGYKTSLSKNGVKLPAGSRGAVAETTGVSKESKKNPGVRSEDAISEAGVKILGFHFLRMMEKESGTIEGSDPEALHDMRVATRRMRAAVRFFGDYLPGKRIRALGRELGETGRALGGVRDLDVILGKAKEFREGLSEESVSSFDSLLAHWETERRFRRKAMLDFLFGSDYRQFKEDFEQFLQGEGSAKKTFLNDKDRRIRPLAFEVRYIAPSLIWEHFQRVRSYDAVLNGAPIETLHALRIDFKRFRYALEFLKEALGDPVGSLIKEVTEIQDHLGELHDADVSAMLARNFLKAEKTRSDSSADGVRLYLESREREIANRIATFSGVWERLNRLEFRQALGGALAAL